MVMSLVKQAVEIKSQFTDAKLANANEVGATIGILCKMYKLQLIGSCNTVFDLKKSLHQKIDNVQQPNSAAEIIIKLLDSYSRDDQCDDVMYEVMEYCYNEQR